MILKLHGGIEVMLATGGDTPCNHGDDIRQPDEVAIALDADMCPGISAKDVRREWQEGWCQAVREAVMEAKILLSSTDGVGDAGCRAAGAARGICGRSTREQFLRARFAWRDCADGGALQEQALKDGG